MAQRRRRADEVGAERLWSLVDAAIVMSGSLDLDQVLRRIVRIACRVVGARYGALGVLNPERTGLENFVFHGISREQAKRIGNLPRGKGLLGAVITDPRPIRLAELQADPRSVGFPGHHPPMRSFLGVPVVARGEVYGNLYLTEKRGEGEFTEEDQEIAVALARQAGVAVHNARLYLDARRNEEDAQRRVQELTTIQELGAALLSELDPQRVLRLIAARARDLLGAHSAAVAIADPSKSKLTLETAVGRHAREVVGAAYAVAESLSGRVLLTRVAEKTDDLSKDARGHYPIASALKAKSAMFAPLIDHEEAVGVLALTHASVGRFSEHDLALLQSFADFASLALRNARLFAAERDRVEVETALASSRAREELKADTLRQVIRAQEEERKRVSRDLHDSAGQAIASILLGLKVAEQETEPYQARARIADLRRIAADAASELRRLALELRPTVLDDLGLQAAVERYTRDFAQRTGLRTMVRIEEEERLDPEVETVVYRVLQESLTNVAKYAQASSVRIRLRRSEGMLQLRVRDDGVGFVPAERDGSGLGLKGMRERAGLVGGQVSVRSAPGRGTTVILEVPATVRSE